MLIIGVVLLGLFVPANNGLRGLPDPVPEPSGGGGFLKNVVTKAPHVTRGSQLEGSAVEQPSETGGSDDRIQPFPTLAGQQFLRGKLAELDSFKLASQFQLYGFGIGGPYNSWLKAVDSKRNDESFSIFERSALLDLQNLGFEYKKTKGRESEFTRFARQQITETVNKTGPKHGKHK